ncbi:MAG: gamma-glutamylcyclotransferase family protein [Rubrobacter sp.]
MFFYGTLKRGHANHDAVCRGARFVDEARHALRPSTRLPCAHRSARRRPRRRHRRPGRGRPDEPAPRSECGQSC